MKTLYWIEPRDKPALLRAMMKVLAGGARISFEGDLSRCEFPPFLQPSAVETQTLCRACIVPKLDFVALPLEPDTVEPILDVVLPGRRYLDDIIHIQIERHGEIEFGSYDNFQHDCVVCCVGIGTSLLDELKSSGVILSWGVVQADEYRPQS
jgi:hypothetical protein